MKHIGFSTLLICLLLSGCSTSTEVSVTTSNPSSSAQPQQTLYTPDLSGYTMIDDETTWINGITPCGFMDAIEGNGCDGIYVIAQQNCHYCQYALPCLVEASNTMECPVFYLDCGSTLYPINDIIDPLYETLYPYLASDQDGVKQLMTPHVLAIKDGSITDSLVGLGDDFIADQTSMDRLTQRYCEMMATVL